MNVVELTWMLALASVGSVLTVSILLALCASGSFGAGADRRVRAVKAVDRTIPTVRPPS